MFFFKVNGAGIILWSDFWNIIRPLMLEEKSFSTILQEHDFGTSSTPKNDEEFAKQLYEAENQNMQQQQQDDEEFARKLQAQWNSEAVGFVENSTMDIAPLPVDNSTAIIPIPPPISLVDNTADTSHLNPQESQKGPMEDKCMDLTYSDDDKDDTTMTNTYKTEEPTYSDKNSFIVHHYNGLEGGILSKFRIIPFPSESASIPDSYMSTNNSRDLEDVIRTKWKKCKYDWSVNKSAVNCRSLIG